MKPTNYKAYKLSLILFGFISFACMIISCHCCNPSNPVNITENLNWLYLNNTASNPELKQVLDSAKNKRVVFQFFHEESGLLNLAAWPMKSANGNCAKGDSRSLHTTSKLGTNITGIRVHLGNVHISKEEYDLLVPYINKPGNQYIIFVPRVNIDTVKGVNYIIYDIYGNPSPSETSQGQPLTPANKITSTKNPSPPY